MNKQKQPFNFSETYFRNKNSQMNKLRKFKEAVPSAGKVLIVESKVTGYKTRFKLESDGEYYNDKGNSLTSILEMSAALGNSKVSIYAGERV